MKETGVAGACKYRSESQRHTVGRWKMADKRKLLQVPSLGDTTMRTHVVAEPTRTQVGLVTQLSQCPALYNRQKTITVHYR
jgi:hypothetical protein